MVIDQTLSLEQPGYAAFYLIGMLVCLGLMVPIRAGRPPQPWARHPFWLFAGLLGFTLLPMVAGRPGLAMTQEGMVCAGWDAAVAWSDLESVTLQAEEDRLVLTLVPATLRPLALRPLDESFWRWPYWLDGRPGRTVEPAATLLCRPSTLALPPGLDAAGLTSAVEQLAAAARAAPQGELPTAFAWCLEGGTFEPRCLAKAEAADADCRTRADYAACRSEWLQRPD